MPCHGLKPWDGCFDEIGLGAGSSTHPPVLAGVTCVYEEILSFMCGRNFCIGGGEVRDCEIKRIEETFLNLSSCSTRSVLSAGFFLSEGFANLCLLGVS